MRTILAASIALVIALVLSVATGSTLAVEEHEVDRVVVDRLADERAVLLVERRGEPDEQRVVDRSTLPEKARYEGAVLDGTQTYDRTVTEYREVTLSERFDTLSDPIRVSPPRAGPRPRTAVAPGCFE